jgi:hypothetical protein
MGLIARYVIRVANFADRDTMQRLLDASASTRSTVGTHLILELIRRLRNDACPIAWMGSGFVCECGGADERGRAAIVAAGDAARGQQCSTVCAVPAALLHGWSVGSFEGTLWVRQSVEGTTIILAAALRSRNQLSTLGVGQTVLSRHEAMGSSTLMRDALLQLDGQPPRRDGR